MPTIASSRTNEQRARVVFSISLLVAVARCVPSPGPAIGAAAPELDDAGDGAPAGAGLAPSSQGTPRVGSGDGDASGADLAASDAAGSPDDDKAASSMADEASSDDAAPSDDTTPADACPAPLAPGNLLIDELMIESVAGTGDYGEWLEVANLLDCAIDLRGLHGECPHGAKVVTFDVGDDVWIPAHGFFVVADSVDPSINHDLPGVVIGWLGSPGDVLRNDGTTVTLSLAGTAIDTLTYPELTLTVGASREFPSACDPSQRGDFTLWQPATASWFPGFYGTPGAPNSDVSCQ